MQFIEVKVTVFIWLIRYGDRVCNLILKHPDEFMLLNLPTSTARLSFMDIFSAAEI